MTFITTASGRQQPVRLPEPAHIMLADVAHGLSQINRFVGAACRPYSVAEHSLLVAEIFERECFGGCQGVMAALMHDAHEFSVGDVATPLKQQLGEAWQMLERRHELAMRSAFALHTANAVFRASIKAADLIALATERAQLLPPSDGPAWEVLQGIEPVGWVDLMAPERTRMTWKDWRQAFIDKADELDFARNLHVKPKHQDAKA